jgi:hypothetical protein
MPKSPNEKTVPKRILKVGDRVIPPHSEAVYEIISISDDGREAHLAMKDTRLERFRVPVDQLTWVK